MTAALLDRPATASSSVPRRLPPPGPLYAIADVEALGDLPLPAAVSEMAEAGVRWIQLRVKDRLGDREFLEQAEECRRRLEGSGALLWIDDRADVAALLAGGPAPVDATRAVAVGVHVGQGDLPPREVRRLVGPSVAVGLSTHDRRQLSEAAELVAEGVVDVVALGPIFATASKRDPDPVVGLDALAAARASYPGPLVAIGGIDGGNIGAVLDAGADTAAVLGAVCRRRPAARVGAVAAGCRRLLAAAEAAGGGRS